jgi:hypothetical protein
MVNRAFVSMPFGEKPESGDNEWTKLFKFGLLPLEAPIAEYPTYVPIQLWRADRNMSSLGLKTNVTQAIESATFVLCLLTTKVMDGSHGLRLSNPNVLWELGYAEASDKPIVVLVDDDSLRTLPILAGQANVCRYKHDLVQSISPEDAPKILRNVARDLVPYVEQAIKDAARGPIHPLRSKAMVYSSRDAVDLPGLISGARKQVDILTTNLDYFLSERLSLDPNPIQSALNNGATVRIVTMDPESVIAEYRAVQLVRGQDIPGYRRELRDGIIQFYERFGEHPRFHLHIYDDLPLQITTRVDHTIITSIVTRGERARQRIQIQFNLNDEGVTESFVSHFQSMFDNSIDVTGMKWVLRHALSGMASAAVGVPAKPAQPELRPAERPRP